MQNNTDEVFDTLKYNIRVSKYGAKFYYNKDGMYHREDGPAIEFASGRKEWWVNGQLHRLDGPAIEWAHCGRHWYINGIEYSEEAFDDYIKSRCV